MGVLSVRPSRRHAWVKVRGNTRERRSISAVGLWSSQWELHRPTAEMERWPGLWALFPMDYRAQRTFQTGNHMGTQSLYRLKWTIVNVNLVKITAWLEGLQGAGVLQIWKGSTDFYRNFTVPSTLKLHFKPCRHVVVLCLNEHHSHRCFFSYYRSYVTGTSQRRVLNTAVFFWFSTNVAARTSWKWYDTNPGI